MVPPCHNSSSAASNQDPSLVPKGSKLAPKGTTQLPDGRVTRGRCYKMGCCLAQGALAWDLAEGETGTTMPPTPSLPPS